MATAPLRTCPGSPTCRNRVRKGPCADCSKKREQLRGSRHERGYDAEWDRLRAEFMCDPANKYCVHCIARHALELATEADHIVPFTSPEDPRRLDRSNLQPLCGTCHRRKTAAQQRLPQVVWNGAMDRAGTCPSLIDGTFARPSTLSPSNLTTIADPRERAVLARTRDIPVSV
jgi:5-methylcytosine-specific restriction protein A